MAAFDASLAGDGIGPFAGEVEDAIKNAPLYVGGVAKLFAANDLDAPEALVALEGQAAEFASWAEETVLANARATARPPAEYYAFLLRQVGVDIAPEELMSRASVSFAETQVAMRMLAPHVIEALDLDLPADADYRDVIAELKTDVIPENELVSYYQGVNDRIEEIIVREDIVDLPQSDLSIRLATEAENASQPAPFMLPPPLIGNTGQRGVFVLPSPSKGMPGIDDFGFEAAAWTLSAHEGRPGHEMQFASMIEQGVSIARGVFAFNSTNVEGWALYSEYEVMPFLPVEGQLLALQARLFRAARAMLDPMLNLGLTEPEEAVLVLTEDVGLSEALAQADVQRYVFRDPGQATSYFYWYSRLIEMRRSTELAMGEAFDRRAFNNFVLSQGLLPPDLLAGAVKAKFPGK